MAIPPIYNPVIPCIHPIPGGLYPGRMIRFQGNVPPGAQRFAINLQCGPNTDPRDDIALHLNFRFVEQCVVRNHLTAMSWGVEDTSGGMPLARGEAFEALVLCEPQSLKVALNGAHFCEFPHRLPFQRISHLTVDGDVHMQFIGFEGTGASAVAPAPQQMYMAEPPAYGAYGAPPPAYGAPGYGAPQGYVGVSSQKPSTVDGQPNLDTNQADGKPTEDQLPGSTDGKSETVHPVVTEDESSKTLYLTSQTVQPASQFLGQKIETAKPRQSSLDQRVRPNSAPPLELSRQSTNKTIKSTNRTLELKNSDPGQTRLINYDLEKDGQLQTQKRQPSAISDKVIAIMPLSRNLSTNKSKEVKLKNFERLSCSGSGEQSRKLTCHSLISAEERARLRPLNNFGKLFNYCENLLSDCIKSIIPLRKLSSTPECTQLKQIGAGQASYLERPTTTPSHSSGSSVGQSYAMKPLQIRSSMSQLDDKNVSDHKAEVIQPNSDVREELYPVFVDWTGQTTRVCSQIMIPANSNSGQSELCYSSQSDFSDLTDGKLNLDQFKDFEKHERTENDKPQTENEEIKANQGQQHSEKPKRDISHIVEMMSYCITHIGSGKVIPVQLSEHDSLGKSDLGERQLSREYVSDDGQLNSGQMSLNSEPLEFLNAEIIQSKPQGSKDFTGENIEDFPSTTIETERRNATCKSDIGPRRSHFDNRDKYPSFLQPLHREPPNRHRQMQLDITEQEEPLLIEKLILETEPIDWQPEYFKLPVDLLDKLIIKITDTKSVTDTKSDKNQLGLTQAFDQIMHRNSQHNLVHVYYEKPEPGQPPPYSLFGEPTNSRQPTTSEQPTVTGPSPVTERTTGFVSSVSRQSVVGGGTDFGEPTDAVRSILSVQRIDSIKRTDLIQPTASIRSIRFEQDFVQPTESVQFTEQPLLSSLPAEILTEQPVDSIKPLQIDKPARTEQLKEKSLPIERTAGSNQQPILLELSIISGKPSETREQTASDQTPFSDQPVEKFELGADHTIELDSKAEQHTFSSPEPLAQIDIYIPRFKMRDPDSLLNSEEFTIQPEEILLDERLPPVPEVPELESQIPSTLSNVESLASPPPKRKQWLKSVYTSLVKVLRCACFRQDQVEANVARPSTMIANSSESSGDSCSTGSSRAPPPGK